MGEFFPELTAQRALVEKVIEEEEQSFLKPLHRAWRSLKNFWRLMQKYWTASALLSCTTPTDSDRFNRAHHA